jgi:hypothetical protein
MPSKQLIKAKRAANLVAIYNTKLFNKYPFKYFIDKSITNASRACLKGLAALAKAKKFICI